MSHLDELRAIASIREARAMAVGEALARQLDWVASLRTRLAQAEAVLRDLERESDEAELAHREASRDLELEVDQVEDGADEEYTRSNVADDMADVDDESYMVGVFGPRRDLSHLVNVDLWK